ncbi:hypothetical protein NC653_012975 [Populus alba x Populus x berolinensis]|uniref:Uncharacterized protein n=1 Tax=Populus alba x Populus x berolinensis TaxID=444605 RepID=A0AAD6QTI9_9ROSI|nr:hypothetical protein NC653_012975 [Populus alba x Populus x berolinensis]
MQEFNLQAECEEMIGRSQQSVTINPEKLKAAVHKLSEAEKVTGTGLSSKVKIRGGVIPGYRHRKASFLSRSGKGGHMGSKYNNSKA